MKSAIASITTILCAPLSLVPAMPAQAASAVIGVNVVHPQSLTVAQENDILTNLKAAGVRVIRTGITPDDKTIDFVKRAYASGIKVEWIHLAEISSRCAKQVLSAGLVAYEAPEGPFGKGSAKDMVSANATLEFWRANGLDALGLDGDGTHGPRSA